MSVKKQTKKVENKKPTTLSKSLSTNLEVGKEKLECDELVVKTNSILEELRKTKFNKLPKAGHDEEDCGCGGKDTKKSEKIITDLIVLIDTSGSMSSSANAISEVVSLAIEEAELSCKPDLQITFLGLEGTWSKTVFDKSHRDYIFGMNGTVPLAADRGARGYRSEQGANAIEDLSKYNKWREGACRAIFYISDEELDGSSPRNDFAHEKAETNAAIKEANTNNVTVFAHHLTYQHLDPAILENYTDLTQKTGGEVYFSAKPSKEEYISLLKEVICNSCGVNKCQELDLAGVEPCISISWGDSDCDCIESSDYEVMALTVCNCFSNIKFSNFKIAMIEVVDNEGNPVKLLPNGTPSVKVHPIGVFCFGNIEPCSCITRDFIIFNEGAKAGAYTINLKGICYDIQKSVHTETSFSFDICKD